MVCQDLVNLAEREAEIRRAPTGSDRSFAKPGCYLPGRMIQLTSAGIRTQVWAMPRLRMSDPEKLAV